MRRFAELFTRLDRTNRTSEKTAAIVWFLSTAGAADAAWAVFVLTGNKLMRAIPARLLRQWAIEESGFEGWMLDECYNAVGDLSETLALLLDGREGGLDIPLHALIETQLLPLQRQDDATRRTVITGLWRQMDDTQRFLLHKLLGGAFRVGVSSRLVVRAMAEVAGVSAAEMAHRLTGWRDPTPAGFERLLRHDPGGREPGKPYPFFLAHPLEGRPHELGDVADWQAEWKWDGIRAQLIRRDGQFVAWSRGEELITPGFPELRQIGRALGDGTVLDGEVVAWEDEAPLPFGLLQRRIGRKNVQPMLLPEVPVAFVAYDILEDGGDDVRGEPLRRRRARLERVFEAAAAREDALPLRLSPVVAAGSWQEVLDAHARSRERCAEGLMLKRLDSPYGVGRTRGDWWKWKVDPYSIDAVLVNAQHGSGRRAGLFTDYTFAVWDGGRLVPIAKAYSGLSNEEIRQVDRFVRSHTVQRFGPVHAVEPRMVFELGFEGIRRSSRHASGFALRFPRMLRPRPDKPPGEADTLETVEEIWRSTQPTTRQ